MQPPHDWVAHPIRQWSFIAPLALFFYCGGAQHLPAVPNPVILLLADCGVLRYQGEYYISGTFMGGRMRVSGDLVHWSDPIHVFSMENQWTKARQRQDREIHACDLKYDNGVFHFFWSVNHFPLRQIGHAAAPRPLGPYQEPVTESWFDGRIDPHLFVDHDGSYYFYTVKFNDGNVIWGQSMQDPWTLSGKPVQLLSRSPDSWEARDQPGFRVNEAPWIVRYRDRYYMLYNANHTSAAFGNYGIGCAEASHPLGFSNSSKYFFPVLKSNDVSRPTVGSSVVPTSHSQAQNWRYTTTKPDATWMLADFDDQAWLRGPGAFGTPKPGRTNGKVRTPWNTKDIWLRRAFRLDEQDHSKLHLDIYHDYSATVYLNGIKAYEDHFYRSGYGVLPITDRAMSTLHPGENRIAVHCHSRPRNHRYIDAGLVNTEGVGVPTSITNCGQPSVVRGPNGFEWWIVYFAIYDGGPKSQAIDRVLFIDRHLQVDGPTDHTTPGYHPPPAMPTFRAIFEQDPAETPLAKWPMKGHHWRAGHGQLHQDSPTGSCQAIIPSRPSNHYLFEVGACFDGAGEAAQAGIVAAYVNQQRQAQVGIRPHAREWYYQIQNGTEVTEKSFALPDRFDMSAYHNLKIVRNGSNMNLFLDDRPAPGQAEFELPFDDPSLPGLFTEQGKCRFDGLAYTIGWDEHDRHIRDWGNAAAGTHAQGDWRILHDRIHAKAGDSPARAFKGDLLEQYEFQVQFTARPIDPTRTPSLVGSYPVYVNPQNYLRTVLDINARQLIVDGRIDGQAIEARRISLKPKDSYHLRVVKLTHQLVLFIDGKQELILKEQWPASQVGLYARNADARFNDIIRYHLPARRKGQK